MSDNSIAVENINAEQLISEVDETCEDTLEQEPEDVKVVVYFNGKNYPVIGVEGDDEEGIVVLNVSATEFKSQL